MHRIALLGAALLGSATLALPTAAQADDAQPTVLFIVSAHEHGYWLPEVLTPYKILTDAGIDVVFATPGGRPGVPAGDDWMSNDERETLASLTATLAAPNRLADIDPADFDALYVPGGAGPMFDLFDHPHVNRITATLYEDGKPVAADCHGPVAFAAVRLSNGELMVRNKRLTAKSNAEEGDWARANYPFLLEDKLMAVNARFSAAAPYEPWVVQDGHLLTGQNPASAGPLAQTLVTMLTANDQPSENSLPTNGVKQ
ncbi:MAG: type 1 glutamine amidotransferase domain-containing protein [Pseudomonadota bacterium]